MSQTVINTTTTTTTLRRQAKAAAGRDFQDWWAAGAPSSYKSLELKASLGCPPELHTKRQHLHHLLAARSGHGDFADYHERFNHEEARIECSCGRRKSPTHPSTAGRKGFDRFLGLVTEAEFFDRICHRH
ncbi:RNase H domain-containing protein [Hirsutella rhossiliensis]